jgi:hypothetical protein
MIMLVALRICSPLNFFDFGLPKTDAATKALQRRRFGCARTYSWLAHPFVVDMHQLNLRSTCTQGGVYVHGSALKSKRRYTCSLGV